MYARDVLGGSAAEGLRPAASAGRTLLGTVLYGWWGRAYAAGRARMD